MEKSKCSAIIKLFGARKIKEDSLVHYLTTPRYNVESTLQTSINDKYAVTGNIEMNK